LKSFPVFVVSLVLLDRLVLDVVVSETVLVVLAFPVILADLDNEQGLTRSLVFRIVDNLVVVVGFVRVLVVGVGMGVVVVTFLSAVLVFDMTVWEVVETSLVAVGI